MNIRVLIAGGGTSGHIHPALAIADQIKESSPDSQIEFCGTERGLESELVPKAGYVIHKIRARGLPTKPSRKMVAALVEMAAGRRTCISLIRSFRPDVVIGTGGYVCSPLVSAAHAMHVPVLLHEQNAFPGRSNRLLSRHASAVCTSFPGIESYFPKAKQVLFTGNPVKKIFFSIQKEESRRKLGLTKDDFFVLAMGGSLGARTINDAVVELSRLALPPKTKILLSAGKQQHEELIAKITSANQVLEIREYIYDPEQYMAAADLIICRAGAITCAEVAALGLPSIMIPYPFAAGDHQTSNAMAFVNQNASVMMKDGDVTAVSLLEHVTALAEDRVRLQKMGENAKSLSMPNAALDIANQVMKICKNEENHT